MGGWDGENGLDWHSGKSDPKTHLTLAQVDTSKPLAVVWTQTGIQPGKFHTLPHTLTHTYVLHM